MRLLPLQSFPEIPEAPLDHVGMISACGGARRARFQHRSTTLPYVAHDDAPRGGGQAGPIGERVPARRRGGGPVTKVRLNRHIRYEPDAPCPPLVTLGVAFQGVVLILANTVLMVTIIVRAAGEGELYLAWAVFAALIIAGVTTALQAAHVGRVGVGHILMTGAGPHFIAISVVALTQADLADHPHQSCPFGPSYVASR